MSRMTYMRSWKSHRFTLHTWLGLNPQIGRPLSRIVGAIGLFCLCLYFLVYYLNRKILSVSSIKRGVKFHNTRLDFWAEKNGILTPSQYGFFEKEEAREIV
jgi:hypothetical protein